MNSRLMRVLIVFIAIGAAFAAGYLLKNLDDQMTSHRADAETLQSRAKELGATIADVRAGQVAYVARGQGEEFWMTRVSSLKPALEKQAIAFAALLTSPAAREAFEPAAAAIENFQKLDNRVQDYVSGSNPLLAADLIFSDGLEATATATTQVEAALVQELQARQASLAAMRRQQLGILGGAAAAILVLLTILGFTGSVPQVVAQPQAQATAPAQAPAQAPAEPVALNHITFDKPVAPSLASTATLCTDLARVTESKELPGLLERTAKVMDASGIIVWLADPSGSDLRPAMSHGYSDQVIARMGKIHRDASNAAASAYRAGELRTVNGEDGGANGAIVAPLITPDGCIGVLSAEMKGGSEKDEHSQSLAAIFAAQLATLVSPALAAADIKAAAQA